MIKTKNLFLTIALAVLAVVQGWAQEPFTFAQVTDIHLNSNDPKPLEYLNMTIADINKNPNVDFVLITGDLADNGDNASLEQLADALKALNKKYYVLTGNHETTWSESGMAKFSQLFGSERMEFEHKGTLFLGFTSGHQDGAGPCGTTRHQLGLRRGAQKRSGQEGVHCNPLPHAQGRPRQLVRGDRCLQKT